MLIISHDLGLVGSVADEICVMRSGRLIEKGTAHQVLRAPTKEYTQALLSCKPTIAKRQLRLNSVPVGI